MTATARVTTTEEFADVGRGITLCFERFGDAGGEPLLLVAGLGQQLHAWPTALCEQFVAHGFHVIRFDNRDAGRSTHLDFAAPKPIALLTHRFGPRQYHVGDMARDAIGLLDALELRRVDLVGMSMGGMIGQTVAAHYPARVRSLTSIMSTTGAKRIGRPALATWAMLGGRPPRTRAAALDAAVRIYRHIGSRGFPFDEAWVREIAGTAWDRDGSSSGVVRQLAAIFHSGDRTREVRTITAPTLVIHGDRDPMVHPTGGAATARAVAGARLETIEGMGHDLPADTWARLVDLVVANTQRAATESKEQ